MELLNWKVYLANGIVAALVLLVLGGMAAAKRNVRQPGRLQGFFEWSLDALRELFGGALGPHAERHLPLILALFFYVLFSNLLGLVPFFTSATASTSTTIALALIVFVYVQYIGITAKGVVGYFKHFLGPVIWLFWLFLPIELIGEVVKPFSLAMRLFGNIYGEDVINSLALGAGSHFFLPIQVIVNGLQVFTDIVQAFIFALLTCAYIAIMSEGHHEEGDFDDSSDKKNVDNVMGMDLRPVAHRH